MTIRRRRRVYIVKNGNTTIQPDMWPGDEVWADDFTLLGIVSSTGDFIVNPLFGGAVN
jgi:hypothetical protein